MGTANWHVAAPHRVGKRSIQIRTCSETPMTTIVPVMVRLGSGALPVVAVDRQSHKPMYKQLYEGYRAAIVERRLSGGQRLPSTRSLAAELRISRIPVLNAFEQLLAEGYFESRPGAGTYVAGTLPDDDRATKRPAARQAVKQPGPRPV